MADPALPRPRRIWRVVLVLSLAFNLAIVGVLAGFAVRGEKSGPPRGFELAIGPVGTALDRSDRRDIARRVRDTPGVQLPKRGQDQAAVTMAVMADPFSADALREALEAVKTRRNTVQDAVIDAFVAQVSEMSDDERAAFAARLRAAPRRSP